MQSLAGKHVIITGATSGIGKVMASKLAAAGANVTIAARSRSKTDTTIAEIRAGQPNATLAFLSLDLGNFASINAATKHLLDEGKPIDVLINNAGLAGQRGLTSDGFELTFGTNHLGHYLWTRRLLPLCQNQTRIVNVASKAHYGAKAISWAALRQPTKSRTGYPEYQVSKLCNVLFTRELAKRSTGWTTFAVHPGVVATDVWRSVPAPLAWLAKKFMWTSEQGAGSAIKTATEPGLESVSGSYFDEHGNSKRGSNLSNSPELAAELWRRSAEWVGLGVDA